MGLMARQVCHHSVGGVYFRFLANTETYLKDAALKHMPPNLQKVDLLRTGEQNIHFSDIPRGCGSHPTCLQVP